MKQKILAKLREETHRQQTCSRLRDDNSITLLSFSEAILSSPFPVNFKTLTMTTYEGKTDPKEHTSMFCAWMNMERVALLAMCRLFPLTLAGTAQAWYSRLHFHQYTTLINFSYYLKNVLHE